MNIFWLDSDPIIAAKMQCDKHVSKMIVESAQMLSTAHRLLDGIQQNKKWIMISEHQESILYKPTHINHPCSIWCRTNDSNYKWLYQHFKALCIEYTERYSKIHLTEIKLDKILSELPKNIMIDELSYPALAMKSNPECIIPDDPVQSYRNFYKTKQTRMKMTWKQNQPYWWN